MSQRWLVFGAGGLLGRTFVHIAKAAGREVIGLDHTACDVGCAEAVRTAFRRFCPTLCLNAAAATDVDRCEREPAWGWRVNALGARWIARACREHAARCVHVSTDYVFSGRKGAPYDESDPPDPINAYGRSKLAGERAVASEQPEALVLRTAWLFGPGGRNFVSQMPRLLREHGRIEAIAEQRSSPTAAEALARWILEHAEQAAGGLYHTVNEGDLSYADCARVIARALGLDPHEAVCERAAATLGRPARRPRATPLVSLAIPAETLAPLGPAQRALEALAERV